MKRKSKKLLVTAIAFMIFVGGAFGTSKTVSAAPNPCYMSIVAENLGRCNLSSNCNGIMSRYKCANHYMCIHAETRCSRGHVECNQPWLD